MTLYREYRATQKYKIKHTRLNIHFNSERLKVFVV